MIPYALLLLFVSFSERISSGSGLSFHPRLLVVSFDGFWFGYLDAYKDVLPNILKLVKSGASAPWIESQFITKTFPNHYSIATGLYEESHGIVGNEFYDPALNDTFTMKATAAKWWDTGAIPIWILNQMQDPDRLSGGMMWPGTDAYIKNQTAFYEVPYIHNTSYEYKIETVMGWFMDKSHPANCVFLYFDEPDLTGHEFGPVSKEMELTLANVDRIVGYLIKRMTDLNLRDKINVIFTSDHGMAEVKPSRVIDTGPILNHSFMKYGSSPVWALYPDAGKLDFVYETFRNASNNSNFVIYKKEEIPSRYHYRNNQRIPPLILVANEGYDLYSEDHKHNQSHSYGNHGYNNSARSMHPFFIAVGPVFKKGAIVKPFRNFDLYPLMCHILKIDPQPNNGSLANVIRLLRDPFGVHVTGIWLLVVCVLLVFCIILAVTAAVATGKRSEMEYLEGGQYAYRTRKNLTSGRHPSGGEENTYLLVPSAVDEV